MIDLLRNSYESVKDIDLYVGGALETFQSLNQKLLGPTFSCIYRDQYRRMTSGDAYFFSHVGNPNPFTNAQLDSVCNFSMNHLICNTVYIGSVNDQWHLTDLETTKIPCSTFKPLDLNPWKES